MLLNDFYTIKKIELIEDTLTGTIQLNARHAIFKGHFPDIPIVPGVVLMQIVKELLEENYKVKLLLNDAKSAKFLDFINPNQINELQFEIAVKSSELGFLKIVAILSSKSATHFKFNANYKLSND